MQDEQQTNPVGQMIDKAQDAVGAMVGMAAASTLGSHNAQAFVQNAAVSDLYEIEAGRVALERSIDPELRTVARRLTEDHQRSSRVMARRIAMAGVNIVPPHQLDQRRQGMIDNLRAADDASFDDVFLQQQVSAHQEALALHGGYAEQGDNLALRTVASAMRPVVAEHLRILKRLTSAASPIHV
jgi:putative membrane protein